MKPVDQPSPIQRACTTMKIEKNRKKKKRKEKNNKKRSDKAKRNRDRCSAAIKPIIELQLTGYRSTIIPARGRGGGSVAGTRVSRIEFTARRDRSSGWERIAWIPGSRERGKGGLS